MGIVVSPVRNCPAAVERGEKAATEGHRTRQCGHNILGNEEEPPPPPPPPPPPRVRISAWSDSKAERQEARKTMWHLDLFCGGGGSFPENDVLCHENWHRTTYVQKEREAELIGSFGLEMEDLMILYTCDPLCSCFRYRITILLPIHLERASFTKKNLSFKSCKSIFAAK